jgi:hypothetical protein
LACYGWVALEGQSLPVRRALIWTTVMTFIVIMPIRAVMVHQMVEAFAGVNRNIDRTQAHFAIVDNTAAPFSDDLVLNRPDLSNRPIRLLASWLLPSDIAEICTQGHIAFVDASIMKPVADFFGVLQEPPSARILNLKKASEDCQTPTAASKHAASAIAPPA